MNSIAYFEIQSSEPRREVAFYKEIFGWNMELDPKLPIEYYRIETDGIRGAILKRPAAVPAQMQGTNAFTCSIEVKDFDAIEKKILDIGGTIALPKFAIPGKCWQGYFLDQDNNVFGIFEVDESAK